MGFNTIVNIVCSHSLVFAWKDLMENIMQVIWADFSNGLNQMIHTDRIVHFNGIAGQFLIKEPHELLFTRRNIIDSILQCYLG